MLNNNEKKDFVKPEVSKANNSADTKYIGDTGGTGGIGSAPESSVGDTGGPGGIPDSTPITNTAHNSSNENYPEAATGFTGETGGIGGIPEPTTVRSCDDAFKDLAKFAKKNARTVFHGNTGGVGGIPEDIKALEDVEDAESKMVEVRSQNLIGMKSDELLEQLGDGHLIIATKTYEYRIEIVPYAINLGMILQVLKERRVPFKDWSTWVVKNVVKKLGISLRTCQKYMSIASTPGAENYTEFGVDLLARVGSAYESLPPEKKQEIDGDAVGHFLGKFKTEKNYTVRREHLEV